MQYFHNENNLLIKVLNKKSLSLIKDSDKESEISDFENKLQIPFQSWKFRNGESPIPNRGRNYVFRLGT